MSRDRRLTGWVALAVAMVVTATLVVVSSHREKGWSETGTVVYELGFVLVLGALPIVVGLLVPDRVAHTRSGSFLATLAMIVGGLGMLVGRPLAEFDPPGPVWTRDAAFPLALIVIALAVWNHLQFGVGKPATVGFLAAVALLFTVYDAGAGPPVWDRDYVGIELAGIWLFCMSAVLVLLGAVGSALTGRPAGGAPLEGGWWHSRETLVAGAVAGAVVGLWAVGFAVGNVERLRSARAGEEEDLRRPPGPDEWFVDLDGGGNDIPFVHLIETFEPLDESDVEGVGGRLVWDATEIELCTIEIRAIGDGFVQVGNIFSAAEDCDGDTTVLDAFDRLGPPPTACLLVRSDGVDDEHCAPLRAEDTGETDG